MLACWKLVLFLSTCHGLHKSVARIQYRNGATYTSNSNGVVFSILGIEIKVEDNM